MAVISISRANCKNCYRCVRHCPVKAIRINGGQAEVVDGMCMLCGICLSECPQGAKVVRSEVDKVKQFMSSGHRVVASVAPSYPAAFDVATPAEMFAMLAKLGFDRVEETSVAAEAVSREYSRINKAKANRPVITTACPVVKNLVEKYYPGLINNLAPVVSPMVAHGRILKKRYGPDTRVVFIGPCVAKKAEAEDAPVTGDVDAVITFDELKMWMEEDEGRERIIGAQTPDGIGYVKNARNYPLPGGLLKTSNINRDILSPEVLVVDGVKNCMRVLDAIKEGKVKSKFIEIMACDGGCISGPAIGTDVSVFERRQRLLEFISNNSKGEQVHEDSAGETNVNLRRNFALKPVNFRKPGENEISEILYSIGKTTKDKELNCGACGYTSCREKAEAVYYGMAEPDMCIPYMRTKAESLANLIIDSTPNGIVVADNKLRIQELNRAAERMFKVNKEDMRGRPLSTFIDDTDFAWVLANRTSIIGKKVDYPQYSITTLQTICYIYDHDLVLSIMLDITKQEMQEKRLEKVREETLEKAQQVINRQMRVAQEIAGLLGETTAESKMLLLKLIELAKDRGETR